MPKRLAESENRAPRYDSDEELIVIPTPKRPRASLKKLVSCENVLHERDSRPSQAISSKQLAPTTPKLPLASHSSLNTFAADRNKSSKHSLDDEDDDNDDDDRVWKAARMRARNEPDESDSSDSQDSDFLLSRYSKPKVTHSDETSSDDDDDSFDSRLAFQIVIKHYFF